jgi:hypothetical protein
VLLALFVRSKVTSSSEDNVKFRVDLPKAMFGPAPDPDHKFQTRREYDVEKAGEFLKESVMSLLMMTFLGLKFELLQPLLIQAAMWPGKIYNNNLVKVFLLGQDIPRPFPVPKGPFGDFQEKLKEAQAAANPDAAAAAAAAAPQRITPQARTFQQRATVEILDDDTPTETKKDQ